MNRVEELKHHIALLEPDSINSHFPAWKNQRPHNKVLHLAGCSSIFRSRIFRTGLVNLCHSLRSQDSLFRHLPTQLGLNVEFLREVEASLPLRDVIETLLRTMTSELCSSSVDLIKLDGVRLLYLRN